MTTWTSRRTKGTRIKAMKRIILAAFLILFSAGVMAQPAAEFTNLRYLEQEKGASISYNWDTGEITITKAGVQARIFLNHPCVMSGGSVYRMDTPPFVEGGEIFIGSSASETIAGILDGKPGEHAGAPAATAAVTAAATAQEQDNEPAPVIVEKPTAAPRKQIAEKPAPTPTPVVDRIPPAPIPVKPTEAAVVEEKPPQKHARKLIVLDPGHGGNDPGAIGPTKLEEKEVVLEVAKQVKKYLSAYPFDVYITRDDDTFIPLKNRALFANKKDADLFVSIHCNSSPSHEARGTRTYIYSRVASSQEAAEAAKYENRSVGMLDFLLNDLRKGADEYLSIEAAGNIQHSLVKSLALRWEPTARAPFYVLANTNMPSVLVEIAFISNYNEAARLAEAGFRDKIARGITEGIVEYLKKI
jgi:N-acetylmuramoyl-L-alanine amidase